jgi:hypothetical protein
MTEAPVINLAGVDYRVPKLVPKQLKWVVPALMQSSTAMSDVKSLTTETFTKLLSIIYWGIIWPNDPNRNDPTKNIKFDFLEEMDIGVEEIMDAVRIVQQQTGLFKRLPRFAVKWDDLAGAAAEWRRQQNRAAIDDASPITNEDIAGAINILVARSVKVAGTPGEAQSPSGT